MRPELRKKLADNSERLVSELDVTISFLASLSSRGVITEEHKTQILVKGTTHEKVDKLIDILGRRPDAVFKVFCELVKNENSDLFLLLNGLEGPQEITAASTRLEKKDELSLKPPHPVETRRTTRDSTPILSRTQQSAVPSKTAPPKMKIRPGIEKSPSGQNTTQTKLHSGNIRSGSTSTQRPGPEKATMATTRLRKKDETPLKPTLPVISTTAFPEFHQADDHHTEPKQTSYIVDHETNWEVIYTGFRAVRDKLEVCIDPLNKLSSRFEKYGVLTPDEADDIEQSKLNTTLQSITIRIVAKMNEFLRKDNKNIIQILKALDENDQSHISKFIVSSGEHTQSIDRVLTEEERAIIEQNKFCLEKLVRPCINEYLVPLVRMRCITEYHRHWIDKWYREDNDSYQLFEILMRRSFKHLSDFNRFLVLKGHKKIVDVLEKGGVEEITVHLKGIINLSEKMNIDKRIIEQLCDCVNENTTNKLNEEQQRFINKLFALLREHDVEFFAGYPTNSIALYFQCGTKVSQEWLVGHCESKRLKNELKILYQILQPDLIGFPKFDLDAIETNSSEIHRMNTRSQFNSECQDTDISLEISATDLHEANMARFENEIRNLKEQCCKELTTKCYQLKIHQTKGDGFDEVVREFYESRTQAVLNKIKLIEDQWKTLDVWEVLQSVNPRPVLDFFPNESFQRGVQLSKDRPDNMTFRKAFVFCCIFEDLMRNLGWKVGDVLGIEHDICDVVGNLMMQVTEQDRSSLLNCMQSAMMNIKAHGSERDCDKLKALLMTRKKYNGLNLACILLEQMILDNKDNNVSWMRIVCTQFIDLVVQLIIEPDYRADVLVALNYFMKMESIWSMSDIYNLMRNGILMYQYRQEYFHRYLIRIRNFAINPSLNVWIGNKSLVYCRDENKLKRFENQTHEDKDKTLDQVLIELQLYEVGKEEKNKIKNIIDISNSILRNYDDKFEPGNELEKIRNSEQKDSVDVLSSCLAVTSVALYKCKDFWPLNTQLVSYCLLIARKRMNKGRLLEISTGEGKSCVIAMVAATQALLGETVDIVTSSPVLSQRDAEEWRTFYETLGLEVGCNVEDNREGDNQYYKCPIVYGTVETFARDILKTEFSLQDVRGCREYDIVIVDEVDSMLIDHGVQCTYLSHDLVSFGMRHFEPILVLIWMNINRFFPVDDEQESVYFVTEPNVFFVTLSYLSEGVDPIQMLRLAEGSENRIIEEGFTDLYLSKDIEGQKNMLLCIDSRRVSKFFKFALNYLNVNIDIYKFSAFERGWACQPCISILVYDDGLSSVVLPVNVLKDRLTKMISDVLLDETETGINLPIHLRDYCNKRWPYWIDNAFVAQNMRPDREYVIRDNAVYPVDFKSTGVIETNKKWGDGLQQFLEMKHGLPLSPLSLITNFLSNVEFFDRYRNEKVGGYNNILGVSGTLGSVADKKFMSDTFSVEFVAIPTSKRKKLFKLDGVIVGRCESQDKKDDWFDVVLKKVKSIIATQRAVLIICEDIATAESLKTRISKTNIKATLYSNSRDAAFERGHTKDIIKPGDVVITTNLGARGTDFLADDIVNKNGGLFVLVTFIPLNDRVEKQAFGRTGRRGATGSCQIIAFKPAMPQWLRPCETVEEANCLRDSIERHRLDSKNALDVNKMRRKQELFREYCKLKKEFVSSSKCDPDDVNVQVEILNEIWATWIVQNCEGMDQDLNSKNLKKQLRQLIEDFSERKKHFESDNFYHLLNFGAVRLKAGDYERATGFYDRVIRTDFAWSAFAHYNRAYCTIQLKGDGHIERAIKDLKEAQRKLENYGKNSVFSEICANESALNYDHEDDDAKRSVVKHKIGVDNNYEKTYIRIIRTLAECQLLHHIDKQIIECIEKLEAIDTRHGTMTTERRNILELIPGADCVTMKVLHEYSQLGLLFTYNIDAKPTFCYSDQIMSSLVMLKSVADTIFGAFLKGMLVWDKSLEVHNMIDAVCKIGPIGGESSEWMSRCVSKVIITALHSIHVVRDISSLIPNKQIKLESNSEKIEASQFAQFSRSQAASVLNWLEPVTQEMNNLVSSQKEDILWQFTDDVMSNLRDKISQAIHEAIAPGHDLCQQLCSLYSSVASQSNLEQFVNCIRDLAKLSTFPFQLSDAHNLTDVLEPLAVVLWSKSRDLSSNTPSFEEVTKNIDIVNVIETFSSWLRDNITRFQKTMADGYLYHDENMLEEINNVLTSVWSDKIRVLLQSRISRLLLIDLKRETIEKYSSIDIFLESEHRRMAKHRNFFQERAARNSNSAQIQTSQELPIRLKEFYEDQKRSRDQQMWTMIEANLASKFVKFDIIILDLERNPIINISFPDNRETCELIYSPPSRAFPDGHCDALRDGKVVRVTKPDEYDGDDFDMFHAAFKVHRMHYRFWKPTLDEPIDVHPRQWGELFANVHYAYQLKRVRALLRPDSHHSTIRINQSKHTEPDSLPLFSCIEQASRSENVSQLAKVLAKYESGSRSAEGNSSKQETDAMTSPVSRDACKLFLSGGKSVEAKIHRQLVVERINDGDITKALKLCCIGHQLPFCRGEINDILPFSCDKNLRTTRDTFEQMLKLESFEQEKSKFMSICDEWYKVLESQGLMNIDQMDLLRKWITDRQFANAEDPVVSMVIERTSKKENERKREEWKRRKKYEGEQRRKERMNKYEVYNARRIKERDEKISVLTEYESKSKSVEAGLESEAVSRDPLKLLPSNGCSDETEVYRQLIVERINGDDITTAFKLYCIGHYIPFCREIIDGNRPISDEQTIRDMFDEMLKKESYEEEKSKFLSILDKWHELLRPQDEWDILGGKGMNDLKKKLLKKWITDRGYTNIGDSVVSMIIRKCVQPQTVDEVKEGKDVKKWRDEEKGRDGDGTTK